jgi:hypothetical protein
MSAAAEGTLLSDCLAAWHPGWASRLPKVVSRAERGEAGGAVSAQHHSRRLTATNSARRSRGTSRAPRSCRERARGRKVCARREMCGRRGGHWRRRSCVAGAAWWTRLAGAPCLRRKASRCFAGGASISPARHQQLSVVTGSPRQASGLWMGVVCNQPAVHSVCVRTSTMGDVALRETSLVDTYRYSPRSASVSPRE